jgi:2-iminobutanoate/2-iminopropanoate deaminase
VRIIRTEKAPAPVAGAPYSQAIATTVGEMVWVSGQVPIDPATGALAEGGIEAQAAQSLANIRMILEAADLTMGDVVKATIYLIDMADFPLVNGVYAAAFGDHKPARATVGVAALPLGALVEIDAVAVRA